MAEPKLTGAQKAAAVIIALGTDTASKIYKYLREDELEQITYEIARTSQIPVGSRCGKFSTIFTSSA